MLRYQLAAWCLLVGLISAGCEPTDPQLAIPEAVELNGEEIGYYCNMIVADHHGPKGQIFLSDREQPLWFASARDTIAFSLLPEEPKNISAIYVSDMGTASWASPEPGTWIDARSAWYVLGSNKVGGMGAPEPIPFADKTKAEAFQTQHGGRVVSFEHIPENEILGFDGSGSSHMETMKTHEHMPTANNSQ